MANHYVSEMDEIKSPRIMKIIFVVNNVGFFVSHRLPIALAAIDKGNQVFLITGKAGSKIIETNALDKIKDTGIVHISTSFQSSGFNIFFELYGFFSIFLNIKRIVPDIVHCVSPKGIMYGGLVSRLLDVKGLVLAVSGQGSLFINKSSYILKKFANIYIFLLRFILKHKNIKVIVQNKDDKFFYKNELNVKNNSIQLIPGSGVNFEIFKNTQNIQKENIVLLPARMLKDKGVKEFYEAARILKIEFPEWRFILAGTADYNNPTSISKDEINAWVNEGSIEWLGHCNNMVSLYLSSKIVCLPSYREGLPKALIEAAAAKCAVVTSDVTGCRESILPNISGLLVEPKNIDSLCSALRKLINNPIMINEFGDNGFSWGSKRFAIQNVLDETIKTYHELV
jgi:glycosyltransferase involved in cell wall biosynthesis